MTGILLKTVSTVATIFLLILSAAAGDATYTDKEGVAIRGYDTVAYFTESRAVPGNPDYSYTWRDAHWYFSSPENRDLFVENPRAFAPRYGGFCSGAMALGRKSKSDPTAWKIIDGKLYLAFEQKDIEEFAETADRSIPTADKNWNSIATSE